MVNYGSLDFTFFVYGLGYVLMAAVCLPLGREDRLRLPWAWLGSYGLIMGCVAWLNLAVISTGDSRQQLLFRLVLMSLGYLLLVEFGRRGARVAGGRSPGAWIHLPLLALAALGLLGDIQALKAAPRYSLALVGGVWAAWALWRCSRRAPSGGLALGAAALATLLAALGSGLLVAPAEFFPASVLNQRSFQQLTGLSIQALRGALALVIAAALARYYWELRAADRRFGVRRAAPFSHWLLLLLGLLIAGWVSTDLVGRARESMLVRHAERLAAFCAASLDGRELAAYGRGAGGSSRGMRRTLGRLGEFCAEDEEVQAIHLLLARRTAGRAPVVLHLASVPRGSPYWMIRPGQGFRSGPAPGGSGPGDTTLELVTHEGGNSVRATVRLPAVRGESAGDPDTEEPLVALDLSAGRWLRSVSRARLFPLGITLVLSLLLIAVDLLRQRSRDVAYRVAQSELRYRGLVESLAGSIFLLDLQGRILSANRNGLEAVGRSEKELQGSEWLAIWPAGARPGLKEALDAARRGARSEVEQSDRAPGGDERIWQVLLNPIHDDAGRVQRMVSVQTDVTERRRDEELHRRLEEQMQQAQKMESLGVLTGGIAHDFNNLLVGILGNAEFARSELPPGSDLSDVIRDIQTAARRAADLTQQMLAYSGRSSFKVQQLKLSELVREITDLLRVSISKKAGLEYDFNDGEALVLADATQLRQVVMNLITNASEALGDDPGLVTARTAAVLAGRALLDGYYHGDELVEGRYVELEVSDTGCGMDEETRGRIFDPFFTTKFTGRGLGLAAVLGIVRSHGGAVSVNSRPGRGTTFRVLLPACEGVGAPVAVEPESPAESLSLHVDAGGHRRVTHDPAPAESRGDDLDRSRKKRVPEDLVLVVEDDEAVRNVACRALELEGYRVLGASRGRDAVDLLAEHSERVGLVLVDLTLLQLSGEDILSELRGLRADLPVIVSSGFSAREVVARIGAERMNGFLQKPYRPAELADLVRRHISCNGEGSGIEEVRG